MECMMCWRCGSEPGTNRVQSQPFSSVMAHHDLISPLFRLQEHKPQATPHRWSLLRAGSAQHMCPPLPYVLVSVFTHVTPHSPVLLRFLSLLSHTSQSGSHLVLVSVHTSQSSSPSILVSVVSHLTVRSSFLCSGQSRVQQDAGLAACQFELYNII